MACRRVGIVVDPLFGLVEEGFVGGFRHGCFVFF